MKLKTRLNKNKGVAGLEIFLAVITLLFMIGLVVMIFQIASANLKSSSAVANAVTTSALTQNAVIVNTTGTNLTTCISTYYATGGHVSSITSVVNQSGAITIDPANYTATQCGIKATAAAEALFLNTGWNVTYLVSYGGASWTTINDTGAAIATAPTWFSTFIVLAALVVLVLLVVYIIRAIQGSGITGGGGGNQEGA